MVKVYSQGKKPSWGKATVIKQMGRNLFLVKLNNGRVVKKHSDQIQNRVVGQVRNEAVSETPEAPPNEARSSETTEVSPKRTRSGWQYGK